MKKASTMIAGAAVVLLPLAAFAQTAPPAPPADQPAQQSRGATFESLDADGDGRISKTEAEANENVKAQFSSYDKNGDGFIERAEVTRSNTDSSTPQQ